MQKLILTNDEPQEPRQKRSKERVDLILNTAAQLFEERGVAYVTTNEIAAAAGVSIGSLYRYFPDKHAILTALVRLYIEKINTIFEATAQSPELSRLSWQEVISRLLREWMMCLNESNANVYSRFYRSNPAFSGVRHWQRQELWKNFASIIKAKVSSPLTDERLQSISGNCVVSLVATLDAAQDFSVNNDQQKKDELLRECAYMIGLYLESVVSSNKM